MRVRIDITDRDIRLGRPWTCSKCPVARGLRRVVKPGVSVAVGRTSAAVGDLEIKLPLAAQRFITGFDYPKLAGRFVKPFRFTINVPARFVLK